MLNILNIKPGITGLAQINKADMSNIDNITKFDFIYLKLNQFLLTLTLLLRQFWFGNVDNIKLVFNCPINHYFYYCN